MKNKNKKFLSENIALQTERFFDKLQTQYYENDNNLTDRPKINFELQKYKSLLRKVNKKLKI